jgi:hypothetical protein
VGKVSKTKKKKMGVGVGSITSFGIWKGIA